MKKKTIIKKQVITMILAVTLVIGNTGIGYGVQMETAKKASLSQTLNSFIAKIQEWNANASWKPSQSTGTQTPSQSSSSNVSSSQSSYGTEVVNLVNKERSAKGLSSLSKDSQLTKLAQLKAEDMAKNQYFSHTSPTYGSVADMMKQYGVSYKTVGENIAKGQKTASSVMNGWMNSSGHRANILSSSYSKIGVGYAKASNGTTYWVQIFKG